jgi:hypothetical protein
MTVFYKYRCTKCKQEKKNETQWKGKTFKLGSCECKGPRTLEMVPMTREKFFGRLKQASADGSAAKRRSSHRRN